VIECNGIGVAGGAHNYQRKGNHTITITVRDDDGASAQRSLVVSVRQ